MAATLRRVALITAATVSATFITTTNAAVAAPASNGVVSQRTYTYINLGLLPGVPVEAGRSSAHDVNTQGVVVGASSEVGRLVAVAAVFRDGRWVSLGSLYTDYFAASFGSGINDAGVVVGHTHVSSQEPPHAFVHRNGVMTDLGTGFGPGSASHATDISNAGHIVGTRSATQLGTTRATMWRGTRIIDLPGLSRQDSEANAVNDTGQVVGQSRTASGAWRAVIWIDGRVMDLGTLGSDHEAAAANDIANTGSVVGSAPTPGQQVHAFLGAMGLCATWARCLTATGSARHSGSTTTTRPSAWPRSPVACTTTAIVLSCSRTVR